MPSVTSENLLGHKIEGVFTMSTKKAIAPAINKSKVKPIQEQLKEPETNEDLKKLINDIRSDILSMLNTISNDPDLIHLRDKILIIDSQLTSGIFEMYDLDSPFIPVQNINSFLNKNIIRPLTKIENDIEKAADTSYGGYGSILSKMIKNTKSRILEDGKWKEFLPKKESLDKQRIMLNELDPIFGRVIDTKKTIPRETMAMFSKHEIPFVIPERKMLYENKDAINGLKETDHVEMVENGITVNLTVKEARELMIHREDDDYEGKGWLESHRKGFTEKKDSEQKIKTTGPDARVDAVNTKENSGNNLTWEHAQPGEIKKQISGDFKEIMMQCVADMEALEIILIGKVDHGSISKEKIKEMIMPLYRHALLVLGFNESRGLTPHLDSEIFKKSEMDMVEYASDIVNKLETLYTGDFLNGCVSQGRVYEIITPLKRHINYIMGTYALNERKSKTPSYDYLKLVGLPQKGRKFKQAIECTENDTPIVTHHNIEIKNKYVSESGSFVEFASEYHGSGGGRIYADQILKYWKFVE